MRIAEHAPAAAALPARVGSPGNEARRSARPNVQGRHHRRARSAGRRRQLAVGTARRALCRNLAHVQRSLKDPRLRNEERHTLQQSVIALQQSLHAHQALRAQMTTILFG